MKSLRDYIDLVEGQQLDEAGPYTAGQPAPAAAPAGNSFDAKLAQANAAAKAKGGRTGPAPVAKAVPDPKGPGPRPTGWTDRLMGNDKRWDTQYAAKYNPDGTAKKPAVAVAKAKPAAPAAPVAAPAQQAAQPAPETPAAPEVNNGPWPAGSPQAAAYSKLSPEDQKWLGGADPTDQMILARAPNGGKPAAAPTAPAQGQGAMPAPAAAGATKDMGDGSKMTVGPNGEVASTDSEGNPYVTGSNPNLPKNKAAAQAVAAANAPQAGGTGYPQGSMEESVSFQNDELNRIVSLVQYR